MKLLKSVLAAGLLSLALAAAAQAQAPAPTVVRITGSTAYRGNTHTAITKILNPGFTYAFTGTTLGGAGQAVFTGTLKGNNASVIIKTSWTGSVGGVQTVSNSLNTNYLDNNVSQSQGGTGSTPAGTVAEQPDVAMSDTFQNSTPFTTTTLTDTPVGVVAFKWVASTGAPAGLTNMTPQLAQVIFAAGSVPLSQATGLTTDEGVNLYAVGRDPDSGTRLTAFAETGVGVDSVVFQWHPTISNNTVTGQNPEAATTVNGIQLVEGNGGYSSGGTLAGVLRATPSGINGYYVTYLSAGDANTATGAANSTGNPAKELSYNGVSLSASLDEIREGRYTFWSYEHLMYKPTIDSAKQTVADALATEIITTDAAITLGSMKVKRDSDGGTVKPL